MLEPRFRRDALSPADKSAAPCCCGVCCAQSLMRFSRGKHSQHCPFPRAVWTPTWHTVPSGHRSPQAKRHLHRFSCCFVEVTVVADRQRQPHRPGYNCSNRPHLCTRCIWCGLIKMDLVKCALLAKIQLMKALVWPVQRTAVKAGHSWLMSAFERTLKKHLVSYRIV